MYHLFSNQIEKKKMTLKHINLAFKNTFNIFIQNKSYDKSIT